MQTRLIVVPALSLFLWAGIAASCASEAPASSTPAGVAASGSTVMNVLGESLVLPATFPGNLCFDRLSSGSVTVRSTYLAEEPAGIDYKEGIDYLVDYEHGTIARTTSSSIPDYARNSLFGQKNFDHTKFPGATNHPFFVWVDYTTLNGKAFAEPNDQAAHLKQARSKLESGGPFRIVSYGDSITSGGEASKKELRFASLFVKHLQERFPKSEIQLEDVSIPGYCTVQAIEWWDKSIGKTSPDLVLLGWGMNDHNMLEVGGIAPEQFKQNLVTLVGMIKTQKHADIILFSSCPPHDDWLFGTHRMHLFAEATRQAAIETDSVYADVYKTWELVVWENWSRL